MSSNKKVRVKKKKIVTEKPFYYGESIKFEMCPASS